MTGDLAMRHKTIRWGIVSLIAALLAGVLPVSGQSGPPSTSAPAPAPLLEAGHAVDWWFAFKFNAETFPRPNDSKPSCMFGGQPGGSKGYTKIGQDYVFASSEHPALQKGANFLGDSTSDPLGATFDEVYNGNLYYVVWNDQFYREPALKCEGSKANQCGAKWGHSKGLIAWDASGDGIVLQVTTPSWPGSGSENHPRQEDGNSLGCINDDDVDLSQDFFALKLSKADLLKVLAALKEEGAVTDTSVIQIVSTGGPDDVTAAAAELGKPDLAATFSDATLSTGVRIIAKAGGLLVPPWQMVSSLLGSAPLRVASFWEGTTIGSTTQTKSPPCWSDSLGTPGPVQIAKTGSWNGTTIGLTGNGQKNADGNSLGANHAKIGVSTAAGSSTVIFGDMNQDGTLAGKGRSGCSASQNARGGLFFVISDSDLHDSIVNLLAGDSEDPVTY